MPEWILLLIYLFAKLALAVEREWVWMAVQKSIDIEIVDKHHLQAAALISQSY